jgi:hypothetical protein
MGLIKIGIETTLDQLKNELLSHPSRYFSLLVVEDKACLCIRTCNSKGDDPKAHILDCLMLDSEGNLVSIFERNLMSSIKKNKDTRRDSPEGEEYDISSELEKNISKEPDMIDWIISSGLLEHRHIIINSSWKI